MTPASACRRIGAIFTVTVLALALALAACGDDPPLPGEDVLAGMEAGYGKQAVLNSLPEGPGAETDAREVHGYRLDRYFLEGRSVEILWVREQGDEPLETLDRSGANPVIFVDDVLDGWGWGHFDERQAGWNMIDRTDPPPPAEAPALEHDDSPDPPDSNSEG